MLQFESQNANKIIVDALSSLICKSYNVPVQNGVVMCVIEHKTVYVVFFELETCVKYFNKVLNCISHVCVENEVLLSCLHC